MGNLDLIVILLMARLSTHILHVPSFFGVKSAGTVQGLRLSLITPSSIVHQPTSVIPHAQMGSSYSGASWVKWLLGLNLWNVGYP